MKRKDIREGLYAYNTSKYGAALMVAVLDSDSLYRVGAPRYSYSYAYAHRTWSVEPAKPSQTAGDNVGLLGVLNDDWGKGSIESIPERLLKVTKQIALKSTSRTITELGVKIVPLNPRFIIATWDEYRAQVEKAKVAEMEATEVRREKQQQQQRQMDERLHRLPPGVGDVRSDAEKGTITLTLEQIDMLLA